MQKKKKNYSCICGNSKYVKIASISHVFVKITSTYEVLLIFSDQIWWNYICYGYYQQKWQISTKLTNTIAKNVTKIILKK